MQYTCKDSCSAKDIDKKYCKKFNKDVSNGKCDECVTVIKKALELKESYFQRESTSKYTRYVPKKTVNKIIKEIKEVVQKI